MPRKNTNRLRIASENIVSILMLVRMHNYARKLRAQSYLSDLELPEVTRRIVNQMHPKHLRALHRKLPALSAYREAARHIEQHFP